MDNKNLEIDWLYNEYTHVGVNFNDIKQIELYEKYNKSEEQKEKEVKFISQKINLNQEHILLDVGTGTGCITIELAKRCKKIYAIDISKEMISQAKKNAKEHGVDNIVFCCSGFLNYKHKGESIDSIISQVTLHHLPDFWKMVAIEHMYSILKFGGTFCLSDTAISINMKEYKKCIDQYILSIRKKLNPVMAENIKLNIQQEYPTFDWVLIEMIKRVGFIIKDIVYHDKYFATFTCKKHE